MIACEWAELPVHPQNVRFQNVMKPDVLWVYRGIEVVKWSLVSEHRHRYCQMIACKWERYRIVNWSLVNEHRCRGYQMIACEWSQIQNLSNDRLWMRKGTENVKWSFGWDKDTEIVKWSLVNYNMYWNCHMIVCEWAKAPKLSNYHLWMSQGTETVKLLFVNEQRYHNCQKIACRWAKVQNCQMIAWKSGLEVYFVTSAKFTTVSNFCVPLTPFSQLRLWISLRIFQGLGKKTKI